MEDKVKGVWGQRLYFVPKHIKLSLYKSALETIDKHSHLITHTIIGLSPCNEYRLMVHLEYCKVVDYEIYKIEPEQSLRQYYHSRLENPQDFIAHVKEHILAFINELEKVK